MIQVIIGTELELRSHLAAMVKANADWERARERGDVKAMRQNKEVYNEAINSLVAIGYDRIEILNAVA